MFLVVVAWYLFLFCEFSLTKRSFYNIIISKNDNIFLPDPIKYEKYNNLYLTINQSYLYLEKSWSR